MIHIKYINDFQIQNYISQIYFHKGRKVSIESNNVIIEKYPPSAKFPMDYFYPVPTLDQSGSNSSTSQYRVSPHFKVRH